MPNTPSSHPTPLTPQERTALRAAAHALRPVVLIGERGLTDAVVKEIDRALTAHQLIKVRAASQERDARDAMLASICALLGCHPVHHLGKMLILYRATPVVEAAANPHARKASEPYIPKKRAAAGTPAGKTPVKSPARRKTGNSASNTPANSELVGKKPAARKTAAAPRTSARTGSALSLRAGARNLSRSVGARKTGVRTSPRKTPSRSR